MTFEDFSNSDRILIIVQLITNNSNIVFCRSFNTFMWMNFGNFQMKRLKIYDSTIKVEKLNIPLYIFSIQTFSFTNEFRHFLTNDSQW